MCRVQCVVCIVKCAAFSVHYATCSAQCALLYRQVEGKEMEMVAQAESEVAGTAVVRGGIKAGKEQVREDGQLTCPYSLPQDTGDVALEVATKDTDEAEMSLKASEQGEDKFGLFKKDRTFAKGKKRKTSKKKDKDGESSSSSSSED